MFLQTPMFDSGDNFRVTGDDLSHHIDVMKTINERLPAGSKWIIEIGHNGNGNIEVVFISALLSFPTPTENVL